MCVCICLCLCVHVCVCVCLCMCVSASLLLDVFFPIRHCFNCLLLMSLLWGTHNKTDITSPKKIKARNRTVTKIGQSQRTKENI